MSYDLQSLGPAAFQEVAAALMMDAFGPNLKTMGSGRDGGRDMYIRGPIGWDSGSGREARWDGYTVFQSKHKEKLHVRPVDNAQWLWEQIRDELDDWVSGRAGRTELPRQLIFVTNVFLTPVPEQGGHDLVREEIQRLRRRTVADAANASEHEREVARTAAERLAQIETIEIFDGNDISTMLLRSQGVRRGVNAFLTPSDVIGTLAELTDRLPLEELQPALAEQARMGLLGEGVVHFDEAGSGDVSPFALHEIAIDLPARSRLHPAERSTVMRLVMGSANRLLRPGLVPHEGPRHLIVAGAPGNGKTTISKFIVHAFRAAMLEGASDLATDHLRVIDGTKAALRAMGVPALEHRRWPIRIDLADYVQEGGLDSESTLHRWIANKVSARSNRGSLTPRLLASWMQQWPCLLVLDGLDEVTDPNARKRLIGQVAEFINEAESQRSDLLVILTTRPIGFTEEIAPGHFERIDLEFLEPAEAVAYGVRATSARLRHDPDRLAKVASALERAAQNDSLKPLLRTPLQVMIFCIITDSSANLAPDKYGLFWGYYETVYRRERSRSGGLHHILRRQEQEILQLHESVGLELQIRSEHADRSYATLLPDELRQAAAQVLAGAGYDPERRDSHLLQEIVQAATHRLVLIVPRGEDGYGFDVRSLQELTSALSLTTGALPKVESRMRAVAASPHWRNTWIFAAGGLYSSFQPDRQEALLAIVETIDHGAGDRLGSFVPIGSRLAMDLLDDGFVRQPKPHKRLLAIGLRFLEEPATEELHEFVPILLRLAGEAEARSDISAAIRAALAGSETARRTAARVIALIEQYSRDGQHSLLVKGLARVVTAPEPIVQPPEDPWALAEMEFETAPISEDRREMWEELVQLVRELRSSPSPTIVEATTRLLVDREIARSLDEALAHVAGMEPRLEMVLRRDVLPAIYRLRAGENLAEVLGS